MSRNTILKTFGIGLAVTLGTLTAPSMAQDSPSSTLDMPSQSGRTYDSSDVPSYLGPVDDRPWGHLPRTQFRQDPANQPRGAQGPMRSDSGQAEGSKWDRTKSYFRQPVGNRGYVGFLDWRESNTDSP